MAKEEAEEAAVEYATATELELLQGKLDQVETDLGQMKAALDTALQVLSKFCSKGGVVPRLMTDVRSLETRLDDFASKSEEHIEGLISASIDKVAAKAARDSVYFALTGKPFPEDSAEPPLAASS